MEQTKLNKIAVIALIFGIIAISQAGAISTAYNIIAGNNIIITQSGNDYTISSTANSTSDHTKLNKSGDTMTGNLNMNQYELLNLSIIENELYSILLLNGNNNIYSSLYLYDSRLYWEGLSENSYDSISSSKGQIYMGSQSQIDSRDTHVELDSKIKSYVRDNNNVVNYSEQTSMGLKLSNTQSNKSLCTDINNNIVSCEYKNYLAGNNINITQSGNNITITGAATWTLSELSASNVTVTNDISFPCIGEIFCFGDEPPNLSLKWLLQYYYDQIELFIQNYIILDNRISYLEYYFSLLEDSINIVNNKTSQTGFMLNINNSFLQSDNVLIPYDMYLNNITTQINNNTGYFNYSVNMYTNYPNGLINLKNINTSSYLNITNMNHIEIPRHSTITTTYYNSSNISSTQILFELELR